MSRPNMLCVMTEVNTRSVADRRAVRYTTLDDLLEDIGAIERADAEGRVRPLGNWSPGQNLQHLARFMASSLDGFDGELPFFVRVFGRGLRLVLGRRLFQKPPPAGFKLPKGTAFLPADSIPVPQGAAELREQIGRVQSGAAFIPASPLLGKLTREEWIEMHLRHAELHLSFVGIYAG